DNSAHAVGATEWDIGVLSSVVAVPPAWVERRSAAMRPSTAVLACPDQQDGRRPIIHTNAAPVAPLHRTTGYAYLLRGEAGLRLDESMAWWFSDDSLDWEAREQGGALLVPGIPVDHRCPNGSLYERPELEAQTVRDRETFRLKWGRTPW